METIEFYRTTPEELSKLISEGINQQLEELKATIQQPTANDYLTRKEVKDLLSTSYPTIHGWISKKILKAYKVGNRTYFKRSEIDSIINSQDL